jgi:hypothetical protein
MTTATTRLLSAALVVLTAGACKDALVAENLSSPDVSKVFATPSAVEQTIGTGYQACRNATLGTGGLQPEISMLSLEVYSGLNNFNMGPRVSIPRNPIGNSLSSSSIFSEFSSLSRAGRLAVNAVNALDKLTADDPSPADGVLGDPARDLRARAFGFFAVACNSAWLALYYDSAGVVKPGMASDVIPELSGYQAVMDTAIMLMDSSIAIANQAAAAPGGVFLTPATWLGGKSYSKDEFVRIVRSMRARFRAGVARTPIERAAVNWPAVIADAENGVIADFRVNVGNNSGWNAGYYVTQIYQDGRTWGQMSLMYYGMSDTSRAYDAWLALPLSERSPFLVKTPDKRWPAGDTRAAQIASSIAPAGNNYNAFPYIAAASDDAIDGTWGWSYYQHNRSRALRFNSPTSSGDYPELMKPELDLLAAEGYYRTNDFLRAAQKIDISRVGRGGLPGLVVNGVVNATTPVPGGTACVPRVPVGPAFTSTVCGTMWEALKYEKRMETAYTSVARWWTDGRGWGDLIEGTALQYPVPRQEMNARQKQPYPLGGAGGTSAAARGTYGF